MNKERLQSELDKARLRIDELERRGDTKSMREEAFQYGRQQAEAQLLQITRLYTTLSHINQTIIRSRSRDELFSGICRVSVEVGEFQLAWIGLLDPQSGVFHPVASSTDRLDDLPFSRNKVNQSLLKNSLTGRAMAAARTITSEDIQIDPQTSHWRDVAIQNGYHSQAAVPFHLKGQPFGILNLYSDQSGFFKSDQEVRLLDEIGQDISFALDGLEAMQALQNSEKKYSLLFEKAGIPASMTKLPENTFADINEAFEQIFGYKKEEVIGCTSIELGMIEPEEQHRTAEEVLRRGSSHDAERRIRTKSGEERTVNISVNTIELDGSRYAITTMHDVTERNRMETRLRNQADLLELAHDSIIVLDMDGRITYWNRGATSRYGWTAKEARGKVIHDLLKTQFSTPLEQIHARLLEQGFWEGELTHTRKSGSQIIVASRWQLQREKGQPSAILEINNDITERKKAELSLARKNAELAQLYTKTERRLENISALRTVDVAIASSFDLDFTLSILLEQTLKRIGVDAADILIYNQVTRMFRCSAEAGFHGGIQDRTILRAGNSYPGQIVRERKTVTVQDIAAFTGENEDAAELLRAGFSAYKGIPLIAKGQVKGVLEVVRHSPFDFDAEQRSFLDALAGQAAIAIDSSQLFENLQDSNTELRLAYDETIEGWSQAMDLRDRETEGHSLRVTDETVQLAALLGAREEELVHIRRGALLHDMGKLGIPDEILLKPGPLTEEEWVSMRKHPQLAYDMLSRINYLHPALDIPYCHHERWDGSGYPRGLKDDQIPLAARVFAVVDVWDAITSDRPYRQGWPKEKAKHYMQEQSGKLFDPKVVHMFLKEVS